MKLLRAALCETITTPAARILNFKVNIYNKEKKSLDFYVDEVSSRIKTPIDLEFRKDLFSIWRLAF